MASKKVLFVFIVVVTCGVLKFFELGHTLFDATCLLDGRRLASRFFRKPLDCSVCENTTSVDVLSHINQDEFGKRYAYSGRPLVVRGAACNWKAIDAFDYDFFKHLNDVTRMSDCQFINYNDEFHNLDEVFQMAPNRVHSSDESKYWYFGWSVCDPTAVAVLRRYYQKPYFLSKTSENYVVDWIFMGTRGHGANLHIDDVRLPSWQAQIKGEKRWTLKTPRECLFRCQEIFEVDVHPGDINTNLWYHATEVISEDISVTVGAEYD